MSLNELEEWNSAYGLSKTLLRNLVVGIIVMLCISIVWLTFALKKSQDARVRDVKEFNARLQHEKDVQDSLNRDFWQRYYQIKSEKKEGL